MFEKTLKYEDGKDYGLAGGKVWGTEGILAGGAGSSGDH